MVVRLVLGISTLGEPLVRAMADWPGELTVVTESTRTAERLREIGVAAQSVSTIEPEVLHSLETDPAVIIVMATSVQPAVERLRMAERVFPAATRQVVVPGGSSGEDLPAQTVIDGDQLGAAGVLDVIDPETIERTGRLLQTLRSLPEPVNVVTHDNPDPDAIGAAIGVVAIIEAFGSSADVYYGGTISHQQNRAFVNLVDLQLNQITGDDDLDPDGGTVLVDHAHPSLNDSLDPKRPVDVIIDHHPAREEADATFVDRRHEVGATSTLVADHLRRAHIELTERLATALWYGIQVDTAGFRRGVAPLDFETAAWLAEYVDMETLQRIDAPRMTADTLDTIAQAIVNRDLEGDVLVTDVGTITDRDALSQAADELVDMAGVKTVCVFGHENEVIYASARTHDSALDLGDAIRIAFDQIGDAGGHEDMAGAQLPFGQLPATADERSAMVEDRFRIGVARAGRPLPSGYLDDTVNG